jgi:23S rRNA pseudouridine1911/1915/1917 synthase
MALKMKIVSYIVKRKENGMDLLSFLASHMNISKKKAKALLDSRNVFVNQRRIWMAKHALQTDLEVTVMVDEEPKKNVSKIKIAILLDKPDLLVINKPAGYLSNGGDNSVEEILRKQTNNPELRVVHRLDKDTSGCLLVAKNDKSFHRLVDVFRRKELTKVYHVIAAGRLHVTGKKINNTLEGKQAITGLKTLDANSDATHLKVKIDTGRTHQIRQHLAELYHPVLGDKQYGTKRKSIFKEVKVKRQMLHASDISFTHPNNGKVIRVNAPLPLDFNNCLHQFGLT